MVINNLTHMSTNSITFFTFKSNDFASWVHNCRIGWNLSADRVCWIIHVYDDHLSSFAHFLPHTDEFIRLHSQCAKPNVGSIDANALELKEIDL